MFLNSRGIKWLVHEADIGCAHYPSQTIEKRKRKLKKMLKDYALHKKVGRE